LVDYFRQFVSPQHPLKVSSLTVGIGAVDLAAREEFAELDQEWLVGSVHAQSELGRTSIATEAALTSKESENKALLYLIHVSPDILT
jgi:hypothetical protein